MQKTQGIYLIVGKSGSGKTSIVEALEKEYGFKSVQSYTTRPKRSENETGHIFVTESEMPPKEKMVAYTKFNGYHYWATSEQVDNADLYVIDPSGVEFFKKNYKGNKKVKVVEIYASPYICQQRMEKRGDSPSQIVERSLNDSIEFKDFKKDITIINDDYDKAVRQLAQFINTWNGLLYEKVVYISHPYGGCKRNERKVQKIINKLQIQYPKYLFLSPIHAFSYAYTKTDYEQGLNMCLWLLSKADEMWVYGDWQNSRGCKAEVEFCINNHIDLSFNNNNKRQGE